MPKAKKLPSGSWRVQASKTVNGNLIRKSFTDIDKRKAEALAAQWQTDTAQMCDIENITLRQAYDRYIASKENILSPGTIRVYKDTSNKHLQEIMSIKVSRLTSEAIQKSINICAAKCKPKTIFSSNSASSFDDSAFGNDPGEVACKNIYIKFGNICISKDKNIKTPLKL